MAVLFFICLIVSGLIAISDYLSERSEKIKGIIDKIIPAQGIIGLVLGVVAIINLIKSFAILEYSFKTWFVQFYIILLALLLATLLCFKLVSTLLFKDNDEKKEKADKIISKIQAFQTPLGWINLSNGILFLIMS